MFRISAPNFSRNKLDLAQYGIPSIVGCHLSLKAKPLSYNCSMYLWSDIPKCVVTCRHVNMQLCGFICCCWGLVFFLLLWSQCWFFLIVQIPAVSLATFLGSSWSCLLPRAERETGPKSLACMPKAGLELTASRFLAWCLSLYNKLALIKNNKASAIFLARFLGSGFPLSLS